MTATLDDIQKALEQTQQLMLQLLAQRPISPDAIVVTQGLSDIDASLGIIVAGEFRTGNGHIPGDGFSGVRMAYPGMTYNSETWNIAGVSNDVLQFGLRASDGVALAGGGAVVLSADGISISGTADPGDLGESVELLRFYDAVGGALTLTLGLSSGLSGGGEIATYNGADLNLTIDDALRLIAVGGTSISQPDTSGQSFPSILLGITAAEHLGVTWALGTEYNDVLIDLREIYQRTVGPLTNMRSVWIRPRTYSFTSANTITNAATLAIENAPTVGTNATITNNYALWVQAGTTRLGGNLSVGGTTTLGAFTFTGNITMADGAWIGLGAAAGRIVFADLATDTITVTSATLVAAGYARITGFNAGSGSSLEIDRSGDAGIYLNNGTASVVQKMVSGTANLEWASGGTTYMQLSVTVGFLKLPSTGSSAGLTIGGDAQWYRSAADVMRTPDSVTIDSGLNVGSASGAAAGVVLASAGATFGVADTTSGPVTVNSRDAATNAFLDTLTLNRYTSGTAAASLGGLLKMQLEDDGGTLQKTLQIGWQWATATSASRKSRATFFIEDTATREAFRIEASGSAAMVSFYGVNAVARPTAYTQTYATATRTHSNPTAVAPGAYVGGANGYSTTTVAQAVRDGVAALVTDMANVKQVLNQVIDDLQAVGLLQ